MRLRRAVTAVFVPAALVSSAVVVPRAHADPPAPPVCTPGGPPVVLEGEAGPDDARSYHHEPFTVAAGTTRVEVGYWWDEHPVPPGIPVPGTPITQTVFDLGLWEGSITDDAGFRGWGGSRQGRLDQGMAPVWVSADGAERGFLPGPVTPGPWWLEIGIAAVGPGGATWHAEVRCLDTPTGPAHEADPVDPGHVAVRDGEPAGPGWYHADFHVHGYHSHPCGPEHDGPGTNACGHPSLIAQARAGGLDVVPVTEYVTTAHWGELGPVQRANPDLVLWPGREVITYFGHAVTLGETPVRDYRHGVDHDGDGAADVTLADLQRRTVEAGGLFGVAHPTIFPGPLFRNFCRGCEFELSDGLDWSQVTMTEVVTGPVLADLSDLSGSFPSTHQHGLSAQQPFVETAIDFWEDRLLAGFKVAPVSGSDSKGVDGAAQRDRKGYGSSATAIWAEELSVAGIRAGLEAGHVYVRTRGVDASPRLELEARSLDGRHTGTFGDVLPVDVAVMEVRIEGGAGQVLRVTRNGTPVLWVPIPDDDFTHSVPIARVPGEERAGSDLGTFWRVDTLDARSLTTIGNAVFLAPPGA